MSAKRLTILGSTGSIGTSTLDIVRQFPTDFDVVALSCQNRVEEIAQQIKEFQPQVVCVGNEEQAQWLCDEMAPFNVSVLHGEEGLVAVASETQVDLVVAGIVGAAGLRSTYAAIEKGQNIALANKETMVLAGELIIAKAHETDSMILPMDSEHNAIFQSLTGHQQKDIEKIILTASGGPFRHTPFSEFKNITLKEALNHPNWDMGNKITIDSATMMNKGLEVIEAHWLFDIPVDQIEVVIHKESIIHSLVEYQDGSFIAQMGLPDMRTPIAFCLAYPDRLPLNGEKLKMSELTKLHFEPVASKKFPCLQLAYQAANMGRAAPAVLNGANEVVVDFYLKERIHFLDIARIIAKTIEQFSILQNSNETSSFLKEIKTIEDALDADNWGRQTAKSFLN